MYNNFNSIKKIFKLERGGVEIHDFFSEGKELEFLKSRLLGESKV